MSKRHINPDFQNSIPIHHTSSTDFSRPLENTPHFYLRLQKGTLRKQSYIRLEHVYKVPSHALHTYGVRNCRAYKLRLAPTSYHYLMGEMGLRNEPYEDETTLYETAKLRLEALARTGTPREDRIRESHAYFHPAPESAPLRSAAGLPETPIERMPVSGQRSTLSYITLPGGGRSRSSSRASVMSRNAVLASLNLNYGSINTNVPPSGPGGGLPSASLSTVMPPMPESD